MSTTLTFDELGDIEAAGADLYMCTREELRATAETAVHCGLRAEDARMILVQAKRVNRVDFTEADVRELGRLIEQAREVRDDERGRCEDLDGEARLVSYESAWPAGRSYR